MNFSDKKFKELEEQLKVKQPHLNRLKSSIIMKSKEQRKSQKTIWIATFSMLCIMAVTFPFYSPALADIASKMKPLAIGEQKGQLSGVTDEIIVYLAENGYEVSSVGVLTKENIVEIALFKDSGYNEAEIEQLVIPYLAEQGYDLYSIDFVYVEHTEYVGNPIYEEVKTLVKEVFAEYGYAEEADYELAGLKETWFSNILTLDMPDHIKESNEIVEAIEAEIEVRNLDVKKVEVYAFNLEHRNLDNAWGMTASMIYDAMAGQSIYQLEGLSYSVKKGHANVKLKTTWTDVPSAELAAAIEQEIVEYLHSNEVVSYLPEPSYTVQFINGEEILLEISNK